MRRQTRVFPLPLVLVLGIASAGPCWGQAAGTKKHTLPDFDIRERSASQASGATEQSRAEAMVELRRANIESFLVRERAVRLGVRIVPNQHGLPKVFLRDGGTLSAASTLEPEENARNFLRAHFSIFPLAPAELDSLRLIVKDVTGEATYLAFNQTLDGIDVFNGQIKVTLTKAGEIVQVAVADVIPELNVATEPRLSHEEGILAALRAIGSKAPAAALSRIPYPNGKVAFRNPHGARYSPITSELVIFPLDATSARLAYRVFVDTDPQSWYEILIDAESGAMLFRHNIYTSAGQANVWTQSPLVGSRQMVAFPDGWLPVSPNGAGGTGWVTTGNNADAYLDTNGDDKPDSNNSGGLQGGRAYAANIIFDFPFGDGTVSQNPRNFPAAAVTNLFYFLNVAHDYYYGLGFNEAAGNFQTDNGNKGGLGNDAVVGEAQQGNETGNAAFSSTPDGTAPKVRVGVETMGTSTLLDDLDYDYDSQTIVHEYGHGVSNRLVGSRTSTSCLARIQSGAMGEGWSDYFAISYSNNPVFGAYGGTATAGVRRQSYEGYTLTYEDIGNGSYGYEVHDDGEIWAATLWDLRKSLGESVTDRLVVNGLKSTPCSPSMTDARDAILSADQATNGGANRAKIWQVFAKHGLGYSASGIEGTALTGTEYDAAYDQPPDLQALKNPAITSKPLTITASLGGGYSYMVAATNPNAGTLSFALTSGPAGMTIDPVSGTVLWIASFTDQRVKITVTDGKGGKVVHGYELPVYTPLTLGNTVTITGLKYTTGYASVTVPANATVLQVTTRGGTGDTDLWVKDPSGHYQYSLRDGSNETLSYALPTPGVWQVEVDGYVTYSGVSLTASLVTPTPLSPSTTVSNLSAVLSSESLYRVTIPAGATSFKISTSGGTGDVDLFLRKGSPALCQPSLSVSQACYDDYYSDYDGNSESITVTSPGAGDWYVDLSAYNDYSGVTLATVLITPPTLVVGPATLSFGAVETGTAPPAQNLSISNPGATAYTWTAQAATTSGGNWLKLSQTTGTQDATIAVSVDLTGVKAGTYQGSVTVASAGLAGSPRTTAVTLKVDPKIVLSVAPSILSFQTVAGLDPAPQTLAISNTGGGTLSWTVTAATVSGGNWLRASPASGTGNGSVAVSVTGAGLVGGNYSGTLTITAAGAQNSPATIQVSLAASSTPTIFKGGLTGAGGSVPPVLEISPGGDATVYGLNFAPPGTLRLVQGSDMVNGSLPTSLAGTCVDVDGLPAYMTLVTPGQLNFQVPAIRTNTSVTVGVRSNCGTAGELLSATTTAWSQATSPEFLYWVNHADGRNPVAALNAVTGARVGAEGLIPGLDFRPAKPGDILTVYGVSFGATTPSFAPGVPPNAAGTTVNPPSVSLGPMNLSDADILYAGVSPGSAGLYQLNIRVPATIADGDQPLALTLGIYKTPRLGFVTVRAADLPPILAVGASSMSFQTTAGQNPAAQTLAISNTGGGLLTWTATPVTSRGGNWLHVTPASGSGNGTLQVSADAATLAAGAYTGTIRIDANGASNSPITVSVTLTVTAGPGLSVGASALAFQTTAGLDPAPQGLAISNSGGGTLSWTATASTTAGGTWLHVSPASGSGNATLQISVGAASLAAGGYTGTVTVTAPGSSNSPVAVTVALTVSSAITPGGGAFQISTVAGSGSSLYSGDGGLATAAGLGGLAGGISFDAAANLYAPIWTADRIRKITPSGVISTVAGTMAEGFGGDGGPAASAKFYWPFAVAMSASGEIYVADTYNNRIRRIGLDGNISTFAGTGDAEFAGDGGPAANARLDHPYDLAFDAAGNLFISDGFNFRIRKVDKDGIISTFANLTNLIFLPEGLTIDRGGSIYAVSSTSNKVVKVTAAGAAIIVAGTGTAGFSGDGGPATAASFNGPEGVAVDSAGNLYVGDTDNNKVRQIDPAGVVTTIAGTGRPGFSGDSGAASSADMYKPTRICVGPDGALYVSDSYNYRIRKLTR